ncbi:hypothetical protein K490DRAFT_54931 [Saccharata proteae CBS 121410]|uniref:Uncharacterized protein n=1 Tax=Saccharata proteae CBS 121410 TaxID=1314787 RepID=A0A6A5YES7_9PEZI|nr:hypothetical protein K490DRAFT_54931 [Saccharata proteae CBS 121410]
MVAPVAKGAIIAASILVAAGIALYENPVVREWIDQSRRKIAIALRDLGHEVNSSPPARTPSQRARNEEEQRRRRAEIIRRNRMELVRRARQEGVAVDLDVLERVGEEFEEKDEKPKRARAGTSTSFDDLVGGDGRLKESGVDEKAGAATTTTGREVEDSQKTLRQRGSGARGFMSGATFANPFDDDASSALFDRELIGPDSNDSDIDSNIDGEAPVPNPFIEPNETSTHAAEPGHPLVDLSETVIPSPAPLQTSTSSITDQDDAAASFHSFASSHTPSDFGFEVDDDDDDFNDAHSTGTLTPTEDGFSTADDIAVLSQHGDDNTDYHNTTENTTTTTSNLPAPYVLSPTSSHTADNDELARSETFSEGGFTDADFSEAGFSELGARTPSSWSEVGSDFGSGSEEGLQQQGGHH